jgi:hypothetical protein
MSMNANVSSVQEVVRDGEKMDLYYYSKHNMFVQARPTLSNNKFKQAFTSYNTGTNQFIFSPDQGLSDVICVFQLKAQADVSGNAGGYIQYGLNRGWGYSLIENVAVRYGGSSQFFWSGEQMLLQNAVDMQDAVSRDTLLSLGGQACLGINPLNSNANDFVANQWAYVYLNLPHNTPNGDGLKMAPLPTELLRQPVLIQVNLRDAKTIFSASSSAVSPTLTFDPVKSAYFQVKQVRMVNSEDLLTNEEDPSKITYTYPLKYFAQQQFSVSISSVGADGSVPINMTGFRNGTVKTILVWLTKDSDTNRSVNNAFNPNNWYAPRDPTLSINGEIFYTSEEYSSLLLDLVNNKQPNQLSETKLGVVAGALTPATGGFTAQYLKVDFSQHTDPVTGNNLLVAGKSITNSIVNFTCKTPDGLGGWTLKAVYLYNSSLIFAGGNCEYSF